MDDTTVTAEVIYFVNIIKARKKICFSLHFFLYTNGVKVCHFKMKDSEIKPYSLRLGNIWKDFTVNNMKRNCTKSIHAQFFC